MDLGGYGLDLGGSEVDLGWIWSASGLIWMDLCGSGVALGGSGGIWFDLGGCKDELGGSGWICVHLGWIWSGPGVDLSRSGVYLPAGKRIQPRRSSCGRRGSRAVRLAGGAS